MERQYKWNYQNEQTISQKKKKLHYEMIIIKNINTDNNRQYKMNE